VENRKESAERQQYVSECRPQKEYQKNEDYNK